MISKMLETLLKWTETALEMVEALSELDGTLLRWEEFVSKVGGILLELINALSKLLKTLSEWGCVALEWPGLSAAVSAWCGHLHGSVLRHFMWVNWCVFRGGTTAVISPLKTNKTWSNNSVWSCCFRSFLLFEKKQKNVKWGVSA